METTDFKISPMLDIKTTSEGVIFKIHVQPKAAKTEAAGIFDDAVKIRLTAPPVDNAANKMCLKFLSKQLKIPKSRLDIVSGQTSRSKQILIRYPDDQTPETAAKFLKEQIELLAKA